MLWLVVKSRCKNRGIKQQNLSNLFHHHVFLIQKHTFNYIRTYYIKKITTNVSICSLKGLRFEKFEVWRVWSLKSFDKSECWVLHLKGFGIICLLSFVFFLLSWFFCLGSFLCSMLVAQCSMLVALCSLLFAVRCALLGLAISISRIINIHLPANFILKTFPINRNVHILIFHPS